MNLLEQARDWQQIKQAMAIELAGCAEGTQALCDAKKIGTLADEIARLRKALHEIAYSGRTKTGMKVAARAALFSVPANVELTGLRPQGATSDN